MIQLDSNLKLSNKQSDLISLLSPRFFSSVMSCLFPASETSSQKLALRASFIFLLHLNLIPSARSDWPLRLLWAGLKTIEQRGSVPGKVTVTSSEAQATSPGFSHLSIPLTSPMSRVRPA
uniref:Uncharacterized protein n=1 Tax=Knipowitschia caucasica TaxID=637954 RepID=A0AAV2KIJ6_KNICA